MAPRERIIIPLDMPDLARARAMATALAPHVGAMKVGLELFNAAGLPALSELVATGARVFYDAKLHDIPNTVAGAVRAVTAAVPGLWMINVHTTGGSAMMAAAVEAAKGADQPPLVIGVTVLTSLDAQQLRDELSVSCTPAEQVVRLAELAQRCGLDGVVASPLEAAAIRAACGPDFLIVTPGVRPAGSDMGDQRRATTPRQAVDNGSDYLVIGRPITGAADPVAAARAIAEELA